MKKSNRSIITLYIAQEFAAHRGTSPLIHARGSVEISFRRHSVLLAATGGATVEATLPEPNYSSLRYKATRKLKPNFTFEQLHRAVAAVWMRTNAELRRMLWAEALYREIGMPGASAVEIVQAGTAAGHSELYETMTIADIEYWARAFNVKQLISTFEQAKKYA